MNNQDMMMMLDFTMYPNEEVFKYCNSIERRVYELEIENENLQESNELLSDALDECRCKLSQTTDELDVEKNLTYPPTCPDCGRRFRSGH
jgi:hypothetical protein